MDNITLDNFFRWTMFLAVTLFFSVGTYELFSLPKALTQINTTVANVGTAATSLNTTLQAATPVLQNTTATLQVINRPCGAKDANGLLLAPGTLCEVNKSVVKLGDIAVSAQEQEMHIGTLVASTTNLVSGVAVDAHNEMLKAQTATDSVTALANQGTVDLQTANEDLTSAKATLDASTITIQHADTNFVNSPAAISMLSSWSSMSKTGDHMLHTFDLVEDKLTKCTLYPTFSCTFKSDLLFGAQVGGYLLSALPK